MWWWLSTALAAPPIQALLVDELDHAATELAEQPDPPHYIAISVQDRDEVTVRARSGVIHRAQAQSERTLDVDLRVGSPELDSTRTLRGFSAMHDDDRRTLRVSVDPQPELALRHAVRAALDQRFRNQVERMELVRGNLSVKVEEEDPAPDFEPRSAVVDHHPVPELELEVEAWEDVLADLSLYVEQHADVHTSNLTLQASRARDVFVDTEGTRLSHGGVHGRLSMTVGTTASDGDRLQVQRSFDVRDLERLPAPDKLEDWVDSGVERLVALRQAPRGRPHAGPTLLTGRAAAVFVHEVLGHRVEGHRQKRDDEGKTFTRYVGERILPSFIDIYDDPRVTRMAQTDLNGHYLYDDEGVPAQRADLVDRGVFVGFLMSRSPLADFPHSTGHGRRMPGNAPVARMGNTVVEAHETHSRKELREKLLEMVRAQGRTYGILVDEIQGGFTLTGRVMPNSFNVRASSSWRVYADGRPDQLVRGIDLVGTPLVAFDNLVAAGDEPEVFNGQCGAESGWVPVAGVSPSLLFERLEFQLEETGDDRPPLLPKPIPGVVEPLL